MTRKLLIKVSKINPEPSISDMKEFGLKFSKKEWTVLTNNRSFLNEFTKNLKKAKEIADFILKKV